MSFPAGFLLALDLNDSVSDQAALAALKNLKDSRDTAVRTLALLEKEIGSTGEAAVGAARAHKQSHERLPSLEKASAEATDKANRVELTELLKAGRDAKKLTKAEADKIQGQVESLWAAKAKGEDPPEDAMSLGAAKAFVGAMSPKPHLAADVATSAATTTQAKAYEYHTPNELAALRGQDGGEATYQAMRASWIERGKPKQKTA